MLQKLGSSLSNYRRLINIGKLQKSRSNNQAASLENKRLSCSALPAYEKVNVYFFNLIKMKLHALESDKKLE